MDIYTLEQNLKCPICLNIAEDPYESTCCGQIFCGKCITSIGLNKCPICRSVKVLRRNTFARKLLDEIKVICIYGCEAFVPISKMKEHRLNCNESIFKCTIDGCKYSGKRIDLGNHMLEIHSNLLIVLAEQYENIGIIFDKFSSRPNELKNTIKIKPKSNQLGEIRRVKLFNETLPVDEDAEILWDDDI